jgi:fused signal recognition particle receptor
MRGLVERLGRSNSVFGGALLTLLADDSSSQTDWESVEDTLIMADLGVKPSQELVTALRRTVKPSAGLDAARSAVRDELLNMLKTETARELTLLPPGQADGPQVILMVGVNGTGKTTTTGKLARMLVALGYRVHLAAADTFRAAAAEQLQTWADRVGVPLTRKDAGADPAAVAFEALQEATASGADILLIDTAGRLHTKTGLMDELGKVVRVVQRQRPIGEVLLVLDATTGQNGLAQARVFAEVADVSGVVLSKLDGTAKGGVVIAVQRELGVPVKFVGLGEGPDDLAEFEPAVFVDALLA